MLESIRVSFLDRYLEDQERGSTVSLAEYKALYPGFEELVEQEYRALKQPAEESTEAVVPASTPFSKRLEEDLAGDRYRTLLEYVSMFPEETTRIAETLGELDSEGTANGSQTGQGVTGTGASLRTLIGRPIGPYKVLSKLGHGGQATVFLARDNRLDRNVALKVFSAASLLPGSPARVRFDREANLVAKLEHPSIVKVYEIGDDGPSRYIAMQYVEGKTLAQLQQEAHTAGRGGAIELPGTSEALQGRVADAKRTERTRVLRVVRLIERLARAVHVAHEAGVLHRDIKPANIIVAKDGNPVLLDFGLAREDEGSLDEVTLTGDILGTPRYMSPEQIRADGTSLDRRTDVYSIGATLYECVTGQPVISGSSPESIYRSALNRDPRDPRAINSGISRDLKFVLDTALEKERERRYANALDFAEDLRRVRTDQPVHARPVSLVYRMRKLARRNKILVGGALSTLVAIVLGVVFVVHFALGQAEQRKLANERAIEASHGLYLMALRSAASALDRGEPREAAKFLASTPERERGWEWRHLSSRTSAVILETPASTGAHHRCVSWPADGEPVVATVSSADDHRLQITQVTTGQLIAEVGWEGELTPITFGAGGRLLAGLCFSRRVLVVWDLETGRRLLEYALDREGRGTLTKSAPLERYLRKTRFSPDGAVLVFPDQDPRTFVAIDLHTGERRFDPPVGPGDLGSLAISPDGGRVFASFGTQKASRVSLFDLHSGELLAHADTSRATSNDSERIRAATWSPDGKTIAVRGGKRDFLIFDAASLKLLAFSPEGPGGSSIAFLPDGERLVVGKVGALTVWDLTTDPAVTWMDPARRPAASDSVQQTRTFRAFARSLAISPDGSMGVAASRAGHALVSLEREASSSLREASYVYYNAWSPDGRMLATGGFSGAVHLWEVSSGELLTTLPFEGATLLGLGFSADGSRLIATSSVQSRGYLFSFWDAATGAILEPPAPLAKEDRLRAPGVFFAHASASSGLSLGRSGVVARCSADGSRLVSSRPTENYAPRTGELVLMSGEGAETDSILAYPPGTTASLPKHGLLLPGITAVGLSPDGEQVVACGARNVNNFGEYDWTGRYRRFDTAGILEAETVLSLAYSLEYAPDSSRIAAGQRSGNVAILDPETLEVLFELEGHEWYVHGVSFSPDGTRLASSSGDKTTRIWDSVDAATRYEEKQRAEEAQARMAPHVAELLDELGDSSRVADVLRTDLTLSEDERSQAFMEILRRRD